MATSAPEASLLKAIFRNNNNLSREQTVWSDGELVAFYDTTY